MRRMEPLCGVAPFIICSSSESGIYALSVNIGLQIRGSRCMSTHLGIIHRPICPLRPLQANLRVLVLKRTAGVRREEDLIGRRDVHRCLVRKCLRVIMCYDTDIRCVTENVKELGRKDLEYGCGTVDRIEGLYRVAEGAVCA